ncbi:MAG: hypothetical protein A2W29_06200 [Gemmatimonadetes bacterium RBG_16_66_8]|nr:MAG: hypothetical protein A2W29_06200 [Gemmatimonadetes bacterium RBG_16_66_8]
MSQAQVRVAVVGVGEIGRGWAAMCTAAGWPVTMFDNSTEALDGAPAIVTGRARALASLGRANEQEVEQGVAGLAVGRSLLQACSEAHWIIESIDEDLLAKQKLFEAFESVAPKARIVTSSTSGFQPKDVAARCRRPDRTLVAHPMNPPDLLPLVELVPGPHTDGTLLEVVKGWLRALGRIPVIIRKPVPGNVAGRITAAVWREAIDLVLKGVIDVDDLDRAVSVGPGLAWAAGGPHLTLHLSAGERKLAQFVQMTCHDHETRWADLASWTKLEQEDQHRLIHAIENAYAEQIEQIRRARNRRVAAILRGVEEARTD